MMFGRPGNKERKSSESKPPQSPVAKAAATPTKAAAASNKLAVAALGKQLSQLETVGKQLDQTIAWVREHIKDQHISLLHDAPKEAAQLSRLRQKLEIATKELLSLPSQTSQEAPAAREEAVKGTKSDEIGVSSPRQESRVTQEDNGEDTREERAANDGGTVQGSVNKILNDESAALGTARAKANEEHKRLSVQIKEIHDLEARNQDLRAEIARKDLRAIRDEVK
jgi:hypothetical protein